MTLTNLTEDEKQIIFECLKCVASGKVILHDWEFPIIMGVELEELQAIVDRWPDVDDSDQVVALAINNSMANLLGYPHEKRAEWDELMPVTQSDVAKVLSRWRGKSISDYLDAIA